MNGISPLYMGLAGMILATACEARPAKSQEVRMWPVWGRKNISDKADLDAKVSVSSDGQALNLKIVVRDDNVVCGSDPINSDHVELWFALPGLGDSRAPDFYMLDSMFYWLTDDAEGSLEKAFADATGPEGQEGSGPEALKRKKVFYGMVHLGLYPDGRPAVGLDEEFYKPLRGFDLAKPARFVRYRAKRSRDGYTIEATLSPKAMLWIPSREIKELLWLCDVVDVDGKKQESLLSSSKERQWGDPSTFSRLRLEKPIIVKEIDPRDAEAFSLLTGDEGAWFASKRGWRPCVMESELTWDMGDYWWPACCPMFEEVRLLPTDINWSRRGKMEVAQVEGAAAFWVKGQLVGVCDDPEAQATAVVFPDGKPGLFLRWLTGPGVSPTGHCGASLTLMASLFKASGPDSMEEVFSLELNPCMPYLSAYPQEAEDMLEDVSVGGYAWIPADNWEPPRGWESLWESLKFQEGGPEGELIEAGDDWPGAYRLITDQKGRFKALEVLVVGSKDPDDEKIREVKLRIWWDGKTRVKKLSERVLKGM